MNRGYIKLWRKIRDNPRCHNPEFMALWVWLLLEAVHKPSDQIFAGKRITCKPGQFTTTRKQLSNLTGIDETKIERFLKCLEVSQQIAQQTSNYNRMITILNWETYQQQTEEKCTAKCTDSAQRPHTLKEYKNVKNKEKRECTDKEFLDYLRELCNKRGCDFDAEMQKMDRWLADHPDRKKTRRFMEGWINRADRVVIIPGVQVTKRATKLQGIPSNPNRIGLTEICPTNSQSSLIAQ